MFTYFHPLFQLLQNAIESFRYFPYKHTMCISHWNNVETVASTSFQRGIWVVCLESYFQARGSKIFYSLFFYFVFIMGFFLQ